MQKDQNRALFAAGSFVLAIAVSGCGGASSEEKTLTEACVINGVMAEEFCNCFAKSMVENLDKHDLKKVASLMEKAVDAKDNAEGDFQRLYAAAMAGGFGDLGTTMRIGAAAQKASQSCNR